MKYLIAILTICLIILVINVSTAYKINVKQQKTTDFTKAETFIYKADPELKKCLLIHGMTGSAHEMRSLALYLQKYGISSKCPKLLGHGTTFYDVEKLRMRDWHRQIAAEAAKDNYDHVIGICAGANLAIDLAAEKDYQKIVLISPLFKYKRVFLGMNFMTIMPFVNLVYRYHPKKPVDYEDLIAYNVLPIANLYDLNRYNKKTLKKLKDVEESTLILFGKLDDLYEKSLPPFLNKQLKNSRLVMIDNGEHVLPKIKEREKVFKIIKDFLLEN